MNEVKEVKGVMIIDSDGKILINEILPSIGTAKWYLRKNFSNPEYFKIVTVTAKIEITGAA